MLPSTPLNRPTAFFRDPPSWYDHPALLVGLVSASAAIVAISAYAAGHVLAAEVSGTVTMENPEYPGEVICESEVFEETRSEVLDGASADDVGQPSGCDEPQTVERELSAMVLEAAREVARTAFLAFVGLWLAGALTLHAVVWLADGEGDLVDTFAVASWAGTTFALQSVVGVAAVAALVQSVDVGASDPEAAAEALLEAAASLEPVLTVVGLAAATWHVVVWFGGLTGLHDLDEVRAMVVSGVLWLFLALGSA